jgi:hypothetical protein
MRLGEGDRAFSSRRSSSSVSTGGGSSGICGGFMPAIGLASSSPSATAHLKNAWRPPVPVQRRERLPSLQLVGDEGPHGVPGDRLNPQRVAALGEEVGEQSDGLGVTLDRPLALVLRAKVRRKLPFSAERFPALDA